MALIDKLSAVADRTEDNEAAAALRTAAKVIEKLVGGLRPFAQPDLALPVNGCTRLDDPVYQKNHAILVRRDFVDACALIRRKYA